MSEAISERIDILLDLGMPRPWAESYARLYHSPRPANIGPLRWWQLVVDAAMFWDRWGGRVVSLGWEPDDARNLFMIIRGRMVTAVERAAVTFTGGDRAFKRPVIGKAPAWQETRRAA